MGKFEKIEELAVAVLEISRNTLVINLRFMDAAISRLRWSSTWELKEQFPEVAEWMKGRYGTEGTRIVYDPLAVCREYDAEKAAAPRAYLHMVLHGIFRHFNPAETVDSELWDLACDMAVENVINDLGLSMLMTMNSPRQMEILRTISPHVKNLLTAEKLYHYLKEAGLSSAERESYAALFARDRHTLWYARYEDVSGEPRNSAAAQAVRDDWKQVAEQMQVDMETFSRDRDTDSGSMIQNLQEVNRERYDYTQFLKRFAVLGEAMQVNDDEFDYLYYTYGMRLFPERRMPLIEALEYKEVKRIREFVVAIDTSGSVKGELVQAFLQKTYNILISTESFFQRINLRILQCDSRVVEDVKIESRQEFLDYLSHMQIKGGGGTDFRPVFERVNERIRRKEFTNLKGLIYFTDGEGIFPAQKPTYRTAFVFVNEGYELPEVPPWAIRLVLQAEEI